MDELVSVAIITYNQEKFIKNAINSVLSQSYKNFEIVISDDSSTDNTVKIIKEIAALHLNKITILTSSINQGASANWYKCVTACRAKYIITLAGDDEFLENTISEHMNIMKQDPDIVITYSNAIVIDSNKQKELYLLSNKTPTLSGDINLALTDSIYYSPATMFRAKYLPVENSFNSIRHGSDLAAYKEIMILSAPKGKIRYIPKVLYKYHKHENNITNILTSYRNEHIESLKILKKKYPNYQELLDYPIYDFCIVALIKSVITLRFTDINYFFYEIKKSSKEKTFRFIKIIYWGIKFFIQTYVTNILNFYENYKF